MINTVSVDLTSVETIQVIISHLSQIKTSDSLKGFVSLINNVPYSNFIHYDRILKNTLM